MTINFIEIKNEYTILLCDIISPYIYQGFQSIYESAVAYKNKNNVDIDELRIFQDLLRNVVPNWNNVVLDREVARIKICSKRGELLESLLKTIVKAHLHIFSVQGDLNDSLYLKKELYEKINFTDFIHKLYVNIAREVFNNPFLFRVAGIAPKDIKANQREVLTIIKDLIKQTTRSLIPLELLIQEFIEFNSTKFTLKLVTEDNRVEKIPQENALMSNPKKLQLEHKGGDVINGGSSPVVKESVGSGRNEIPLLNTVGQNVMDKVFSSFNIKESLPNLVDMDDVESVVSKSHTINYKSHHTLSNFLKEAPKNIVSDTIKQSAIEDYDAIYNNDD